MTLVIDRAFMTDNANTTGPDETRIEDLLVRGAVVVRRRDRSIRSLDGSRCQPPINSDDLRAIATDTRISKLDLANGDISDADVATIRTLEQLAELNLSHTKVSIAGAERLILMPRLTFLSLIGCTLNADRLRLLRRRALQTRIVT